MDLGSLGAKIKRCLEHSIDISIFAYTYRSRISEWNILFINDFVGKL